MKQFVRLLQQGRVPRIHGWEAMAPLKQRKHKKGSASEHSIHGWEAMAPLKPNALQWFMDLTGPRIHGWEAMAPLKLRSPPCPP